MDPKAAYEQGRERALREHAQLEAKTRIIAFARLGVALGVVALVGAIAWAHLPGAAWLGVVVLVGTFGVLVFAHARAHDRKDRAAASVRFHERGLARLDGSWTKFPRDGARFGDDAHPYAADLDLFGRASLFQLVDATETRGGEELLARWLKEPLLARFPDALRERQAGVVELAAKLDWRERLSVSGAVLGAERPDPGPFLAWAEAPPLTVAAPVKLLAKLLPLCTIALFVAGRMGAVHVWAWVGSLAVGLAVSAAHRGRLAALTAAASSREGQLARFAEMLALVERGSFDAPILARMQGDLRATGSNATAEMASLGRIVSFLDARNNEVFRFFIGPMLMWDLWCALALDGWRTRAGRVAFGWFRALAELEALASLAGFTFERPDHTFPELVAGPTFASSICASLICSSLIVSEPDAGSAGFEAAAVLVGVPIPTAR